MLTKYKTELERKLKGKQVTTKLLFDLIIPERTEWNKNVLTSDTINFSTFFGRPIRYYFTVYANELAYRICLQDDSQQDGTTRAYIGFITSELSELDEYKKPVGEYEYQNGVEILIYHK